MELTRISGDKILVPMDERAVAGFLSRRAPGETLGLFLQRFPGGAHPGGGAALFAVPCGQCLLVAGYGFGIGNVGLKPPPHRRPNPRHRPWSRGTGSW